MDLVLNITSERVAKRKSAKKQSLDKKNETLPISNDSPPKRQDKYLKERKKKKLKEENLKNITDNNESKEHHSSPQVFISSLFKHNPIIPEVKLTEVKQINEPLFSSEGFADLILHPHLVSCLSSRFSVTKMTAVQERTIPLLLKGKDALVKSLTGSGKTLAYAIPIMQKLQEIRPKIQRVEGIHAVVIVPTRELAIQSYECFEKLSRAFTWIVPGYLIGGEKKKSEKARIRKGITILVSTPGRLLDHLEHTTNLGLSNVRWLVVDEADRLFELGFEQSVSMIISYLKEHCELRRQTVLLSATLSKDVERLAGMSLINPAIVDVAATSFDDVMSSDTFVIPSHLKQYFILTPIKLRLVCLSAFIIKKCALGVLKALIFVPTQDVVDFHHLLFNNVLGKLLEKINNPVHFLKLHGNMSQQERAQVFKDFRETRAGILFCTDVAARGLDLPKVDWIIQYSAPCRPEEYVHRVGRTARIGSHGQALLFLLPSETDFLQMLQEHRINLEDTNMEELLKAIILLELTPSDGRHHPLTVEEHATCLQMKYENYVYGTPAAHELAKKAFTSFARAYSSYPKALKNIFSIRQVHLGHLAKSFCLRESPSTLGMQVSFSVKMNNKLRSKPTIGVKRKLMLSSFSEFDSGLEAEHQEKDATEKSQQQKIWETRKPFKRLKPAIGDKRKLMIPSFLEFDNGVEPVQQHKDANEKSKCQEKWETRKSLKSLKATIDVKRNPVLSSSSFSEFDSGLEPEHKEQDTNGKSKQQEKWNKRKPF